MSLPARRCDLCGRTIRKPGLIMLDNIFCSAPCKRRFPSALRRRLTAHYRQMAKDADRWIAEALRWNQSHADEQPSDIESLRLVKFGANEVVDALRAWAPIPQRSLRLINSAMLGAMDEPPLGEPPN